MFFHKSLESLHKYVSPSALPEEYGGERPPVDGQRLVREFLDPQHERLTGRLVFTQNRQVCFKTIVYCLFCLLRNSRPDIVELQLSSTAELTGEEEK